MGDLNTKFDFNADSWGDAPTDARYRAAIAPREGEDQAMSQRLTRSEVEFNLSSHMHAGARICATSNWIECSECRSNRALLAAWDALEEYEACADPVAGEVPNARWDRLYKQVHAALPAPEVEP